MLSYIIFLLMLPKQLGELQLGKCPEFKVSPGLGLQCTVTDVSKFTHGNATGDDPSTEVILESQKLDSSTKLADTDNYQVVIGNRRWVETDEFKLNDNVNQDINDNEGSGQTVILVKINGMQL